MNYRRISKNDLLDLSCLVYDIEKIVVSYTVYFIMRRTVQLINTLSR